MQPLKQCIAIAGLRFVCLALTAASAMCFANEPAAPRVEAYKRVNDTELKVHVFEPAEQTSSNTRTAVVMFHGGGWSAGGPEWVYASARRYAARGLVAVAVQYRLSDQKNITPLDAMEDARDAMRWVRSNAKTLRVDPARVVGYGVSAGGHLASSTAWGPVLKEGVSSVPNALLMYSPAVAVADSGWVKRILLDRSTAEAISPDRVADAAFPPTLINQGEEDVLTPLSGARRFCARLKQANTACELRTFAGLGHLLTRKLDEQEQDYDVDAVARADAHHAEEKFLAARGFLDASRVAGHDGPEAVVRAHLADFNARNVDAMAKRVAEDFVWYDVNGDQTKVETKGREALRKGLEGYFKSVPTAKSELHMLTTNGRFVSARERVTWKNAKGEPRSQNAMSVYEVEEGLIKRVWYFPAVK
jgi:acetyl esterase